ncbi:Replication protein O [Mycetohabitans rhizoxinica]|uniref:Replication protein O n=1 Tax=Mycetohabitans rhizoxinica TaxID=412963 RepID=UPI0030D220E6
MLDRRQSVRSSTKSVAQCEKQSSVERPFLYKWALDMSIAQHFVAGEGSVCPPNQQHFTPVPDDTEALSQFACDTTNLPWLIFRAAFRAEHLAQLPARARALLAALARTVDAQRPYAAIFARRELLTGRALQSMRTFYRGLDDLEAAGLIDRPPQKRHGGVGLFGRAYLHLTPKAATLLGLVEPQDEVSAPALDTTTANAPAIPTSSTQSSTLPSANMADGAIYKDLYPTAFQKRQPGALPQDLERLTSLGFNKFFIFKLMAEARKSGKRLSDVVDMCWHSLKKAVAPIAYLRSLLRKPVDFSHQARQRRDEAHQRTQHDAEHRSLTQALHDAAGLTFVDPTKGLTVEIGEDGASALLHLPGETRPRSAAGTRMSDIARAIVSGQLQRSAKVCHSAHQAVDGSCKRSEKTSEEGGQVAGSLTHVQQMRELLKRRATAYSFSA